MFKIIKKEMLSPMVSRLTVSAPLVARRCRAGQFIILRTDADGERIPLTIGGYDREAGTVSVMFQVAGATTEKLMAMNEGDGLADFVGPLGKPTEIEGLKRVCVVGGGVGCAIAYPIAKALHEQGTHTTVVIGFRDTSRIILEEEFKSASDVLHLLTDDGSNGRKGFTTVALQECLEAGEKFDEVIAIGPLRMMQAVANLTKTYGIKTTVSMNPIMIDGTGMCGGCRLTVGGEMKFACVDGPDFDGHEVDWDEALARGAMYRDFEQAEHKEVCNLLGISK
ncbi:MAG: sulfide/dihydroorotate dehydrogenase-like FAD/NAD-binding protein [Oscillospiraceae bacterium]|jgi:ferredoxin--NADP+ reductase|nr:sulfide/dihydroorotate dehydrogenase-like FAD/NAD-binding protein [Oscillospiraceae bacterium]